MNQAKECHNIMAGGLHCGSPAMRGSNFCYFHGRPQRPRRARRPAENPIPVALVFDEETALQAFNEIVQALAGNHISNRRAALLTYAVQMASSKSARVPRSMQFDNLGEFEDLLDPEHSHDGLSDR